MFKYTIQLSKDHLIKVLLVIVIIMGLHIGKDYISNGEGGEKTNEASAIVTAIIGYVLRGNGLPKRDIQRDLSNEGI